MPLVFAGAGSLRAALEQSGDQVLGWLNHQRLSAVYKSARVLVMPSRCQEPFGISGLEDGPSGRRLQEDGNLFRGPRQ